MAREIPKQTKQEPESEELAAARKKKSLGTLPKGGMSPLADREDPGAWTAPRAPLNAREVRVAPLVDSRKTAPEEPVGGWVDASAGRGRIRLSGQAAADHHPGLRQQRVQPKAVVKDKDYPDMGPRAALGRPRARVRRRTGKIRAAAEAAAKERQEEDRNYQDAMKDMEAEDEGYDEVES